MKLDDTSISKFKIAKEFSDNDKRINSIDISNDGKNLITSSDDDTINIYDCVQGIKAKSRVFSKKYGVDLIKFTHATQTALHTSTKENDTIRYLSLHDNKYLRYFIGHEKRVVTLGMSPADDHFISGSLDQTIRLWELKNDKSTGVIKDVGLDPIASYDPEGLIFAVGVNSELIKLYDVRLHEKGPFSTIKHTRQESTVQHWKSLKFSPNGKQILISTDYEELYILDAFSGQLLHTLTFGPKLTAPIEHPCKASYTPDSQYILCGSLDGCVHVWSATKGVKVTVLRPDKSSQESVQCVMFNPRYMLMATASTKLAFWIPHVDEYHLQS